MSSTNIYSIYKATNTVNGKCYIGFTNNFHTRIKKHKKCSESKVNRKLYDAINKYGWNAFQWEVIYQSKDRYHTLFEMETIFIDQYNSIQNGYNMVKGGLCGSGIPWNKGKKGLQKLSLEHKTKLIAANKTRIHLPHTEETKQKIREKRANQIMINYQVTCPHCNKQGGNRGMKKWHFDRCQLRQPISTE